MCSVVGVLVVDGIMVNCVVLGFIEKDVGMCDGVLDDELVWIVFCILLGCFGCSDEVVVVIVFLLLFDVSYIIGQLLYVNGGLI